MLQTTCEGVNFLVKSQNVKNFTSNYFAESGINKSGSFCFSSRLLENVLRKHIHKFLKIKRKYQNRYREPEVEQWNSGSRQAS